MKPTYSTEPSPPSDDDLDEAPTVTASDLARARLRVGGREVSRKAFTAAVQEQLGKQRVSIMLDTAIIAFFKNQAGGKGYQTLINATLREAMQRRTLEDTLRNVIREELHSPATQPCGSRPTPGSG